MNERLALKTIKTADNIVQRVIDIIVIIILLIGLYFLIDTIWVYMHSRADLWMPYKPVDGDVSILKQLSEDCVGWITLDDTNIDYPIMQGEDNYEYLNKDPFGDYALAGSIFLDFRNAPDFSDEYSIVYGHHMQGGYMFGALDLFEDPEYFDGHKTGTLYTERGIFPVTVIAFLYTDARNDTVFDPEIGRTGIEPFIEESALRSRDSDDGKIVALTTCKSPTSTRRACVFLRVDEPDETTGREDVKKALDDRGKEDVTITVEPERGERKARELSETGN